MALTQKQAFYSGLIETAHRDGLSLQTIADQNDIHVSRLYSMKQWLRRKRPVQPTAADSPSGFARIPLATTGSPELRLSTTLANGQQVDLRLPVDLLDDVLQVLSQ